MSISLNLVAIDDIYQNLKSLKEKYSKIKNDLSLPNEVKLRSLMLIEASEKPKRFSEKGGIKRASSLEDCIKYLQENCCLKDDNYYFFLLDVDFNNEWGRDKNGRAITGFELGKNIESHFPEIKYYGKICYITSTDKHNIQDEVIKMNDGNIVVRLEDRLLGFEIKRHLFRYVTEIIKMSSFFMNKVKSITVGKKKIVGSSLIKSVVNSICDVAKTDRPVFISGETGTGKTLIAKFIHEKSERKGRFEHINCANFSKYL